MLPDRTDEGLFLWGFSSEKCTRCGKCLSGCAYAGLTPERAVGLMEKAAAAPGWHAPVGRKKRLSGISAKGPLHLR
jgi:ferredoxin